VDAFVRVLGADYSVPPAFVGRRVGVRVSPTSVRLSSESAEIAVHRRSFVPADVVLGWREKRPIDSETVSRNSRLSTLGSTTGCLRCRRDRTRTV
jgi:hypothetical protein